MPVRIIVGGDIVPTDTNFELFRQKKANALVGEDLLGILQLVDYTILNLEVPLTDYETPIVKCGPNLIAPRDTVAGLKEINPHFYTLANNHILDQDQQGLISTMQLLDDAGISYAGSGVNLYEASKPYIANINGIKIGIYCCAEHEFSIATEETGGANPYNPLESFDHVKYLKENCRLVIVLYHGGKEHYRYPSPMLQKIFHKFAESGADYVVAQHTHCIGCVEQYKGSMLVYGQGNFLFDRSESEYWKTSVLLDLNVDAEQHSCDIIPLVKEKNKVRIAQGETAKIILHEMNIRNEEIKSSEFVQRNYEQFADEMRTLYLNRMSGNIGKFLPVRFLNKITKSKFLNVIYSSKRLPAIENFIDCEAHRELMLQGIKLKNTKK